MMSSNDYNDETKDQTDKSQEQQQLLLQDDSILLVVEDEIDNEEQQLVNDSQIDEPHHPVTSSEIVQVYTGRPCAMCRKSHTGCDRHRPCSRCIRLKMVDCCVDPVYKSGQPSNRPPARNSSVGSLMDTHSTNAAQLLHNHHYSMYHQHNHPHDQIMLDPTRFYAFMNHQMNSAQLAPQATAFSHPAPFPSLAINRNPSSMLLPLPTQYHHHSQQQQQQQNNGSNFNSGTLGPQAWMSRSFVLDTPLMLSNNSAVDNSGGSFEYDRIVNGGSNFSRELSHTIKDKAPIYPTPAMTPSPSQCGFKTVMTAEDDCILKARNQLLMQIPKYYADAQTQTLRTVS